jgi:HlyD family secretion protein
MTATPARSNTARLWVIAAVALLLIFYGVHMLTRGKLPIRVAAATIGNLIGTVASNGKVEPQSNFEAHAPYGGVVRDLYIHAGDKVPAGKLLLAMDDTEAQAHAATALAALKGAQAAYQAAQHGGTAEERISLNGELQKATIDRDQAQHDLAALQKLEATGAASPSEVSAAQERLDSDNSSIQVIQQRQTSRYDAGDLAHAKANLDDAEAAYAAAEDALHQAVVHAPFAGTVYSLPVSRTEYVQQGDRLLSMADLTKMQVLAYFDEPEIGNLAVGQPATIVWDARPDEV